MSTIFSRIFIAATLSLALAGCVTVAEGPAFKPLASGGGKAVVYVYSVGGVGESPVISLDGKEVARLHAKGYVAVPVSAGKHTVSMRPVMLGMKMFVHDVAVDVPRGGAAYLSVTREYGGLGFGPGGPYPIYVTTMRSVSPEVGRNQIRQTKRST